MLWLKQYIEHPATNNASSTAKEGVSFAAATKVKQGTNNINAATDQTKDKIDMLRQMLKDIVKIMEAVMDVIWTILNKN